MTSLVFVSFTAVFIVIQKRDFLVYKTHNALLVELTNQYT